MSQHVSHFCDNSEDIPDTQLEALSKLPSEQWQEAWTEIVATAPNQKVTSKHVKSVVARRLQVASNELPEPYQHLQTSLTHTYEIGQLVLIQSEDSAAQQQCRQYSGCWGIVHQVFESAAVVAVGGEMVKYLLCDLQPIENPSPALRQVCARVAHLWQVPNLPQSVECLLEMFYQQRLDFEQEDLGVLAAIESYLGKA